MIHHLSKSLDELNVANLNIDMWQCLSMSKSLYLDYQSLTDAVKMQKFIHLLVNLDVDLRNSN